MEMKKKNLSAFTIIEALVVIAVFSVISIIITQSLLTALKTSRKSDVQVGVRENINYIMSVMERRLRNADEINATSTSTQINYTNETGNAANFTCQGLGTSYGRVRDEDGQISSADIDVESCNFTYTPADTINNVPQKVDITISAKGRDVSSVEETLTTASTTVYLRVY
jgi:type II secretory pathway pseudopilin PulG